MLFKLNFLSTPPPSCKKHHKQHFYHSGSLSKFCLSSFFFCFNNPLLLVCCSCSLMTVGAIRWRSRRPPTGPRRWEVPPTVQPVNVGALKWAGKCSSNVCSLNPMTLTSSLGIHFTNLLQLKKNSTTGQNAPKSFSSMYSLSLGCRLPQCSPVSTRLRCPGGSWFHCCRRCTSS